MSKLDLAAVEMTHLESLVRNWLAGYLLKQQAGLVGPSVTHSVKVGLRNSVNDHAIACESSIEIELNDGQLVIRAATYEPAAT